MNVKVLLWVCLLALIPASTSYAQDVSAYVPNLPRAHVLNDVGYEAQWWNNCGPATLTNGLTFFGYQNDQGRAQNFMKPNLDDKNVNPWELVDFVNQEVTELPINALWRVGGNVDLLKVLIANDFPVIIEQGYDPPPHDLGWMGHYLLMIGYDDSVGVFVTHDSYDGANLNYSYEHIERYWQHFNYNYVVLFTPDRRDILLNILDEDIASFDPTTGYHHNEANTITALNRAIAEANADQTDQWAWFNMGTNFVSMAEIYAARGDDEAAQDFYQRAATAYDRARNIGLPWRMMWYQFDIYEAYYHMGRYDDMLEIARSALNDGGGHLVEETLYYGARAREAMGEYDRALRNYNSALQINPNHRPSQQARADLRQRMNNS